MLSAVPPVARHVTVCLSVTLVHLAKAIRRNEMSFGRDTHVVPSNTVLDGKGKFGSWNPLSKFALQIVAKPLEIVEWLL